ncbi:MAG: threonine synthase, partial [Aureibaculum sp.]
ISNAMDVGDPSNFVRIQKIYGDNYEKLKSNLHSYSFTDDETRTAMLHLYKNCNYIADPHGAVGYLGLKKHHIGKDMLGIFLETAHPIKFLDVVQPVINKELPYPLQIKDVIHKTKKAKLITDYRELKSFLLNN